MKLTEDEIINIAIRLDEIIGNEFHEAIYDCLLQREEDEYGDIPDEDVRLIKEHLKSIL